MQNVSVSILKNRLVVFTGASGSGKSSLAFDILDRAARRRSYGTGGAGAEPGAHDGIDGWECFDKVITVDQAPLGRSTRSNAATYTVPVLGGPDEDAIIAERLAEVDLAALAAEPRLAGRGLFDEDDAIAKSMA